MATSWNAEEVRRIASAEEIEIAPTAPDRGYTPVWVVRVGDELFVRSYRGEAGQWYQAARADRRARIRVNEVERAVTVEHSADVDQGAIDEAYRVKYGRYAGSYLDPMIVGDVRLTSLRLGPA